MTERQMINAYVRDLKGLGYLPPEGYRDAAPAMQNAKLENALRKALGYSPGVHGS